MRIYRWLALLLACGWLAFPALQAAENLPAKPERYVSDRALILDESQIAAMNSQLETFERETSNQIVVALFASLPEGAEMAQYSTEVFHAWGVGQKGQDNGAILFVFKNDRKLFIATGRGLEGALPDATCKQIIETEIVPRFRQNDFPGGIQAGISAMMAATRGEYKGTGKTVRDGETTVTKGGGGFGGIILLLVIGFIILSRFRGGGAGGGMLLGGGGFNTFGGGGFLGGGGGFGGGGDSGGGGFGGGGGGGFSGGGGDSGGGGAGGSW